MVIGKVSFFFSSSSLAYLRTFEFPRRTYYGSKENKPIAPPSIIFRSFSHKIISLSPVAVILHTSQRLLQTLLVLEDCQSFIFPQPRSPRKSNGPKSLSPWPCPTFLPSLFTSGQRAEKGFAVAVGILSASFNNSRYHAFSYKNVTFD